MITFRRALRENVQVILGLIGPSGSGKTYSAMRLATGLAGDKPFCVIDTEAGRAKHYAGLFTFDHADLLPPFRPQAYADAIKAADDAKYPVIVVDSCSHEHAGEGGLLEWQEEELTRMAGDDWKKREACKMAAWIRPKMAHKAMVQRLLQVRAHLILCFRAEEKVAMERDDKGKVQIIPKGFMPICEKNLPYELTASFLLTPDAPGIPKPLKLQEQMKPFISLKDPITEQAGEKLAQWAAGGAAKEYGIGTKQGDLVKMKHYDTPVEQILGRETPGEVTTLIETLANGEKLDQAELRGILRNYDLELPTQRPKTPEGMTTFLEELREAVERATQRKAKASA